MGATLVAVLAGWRWSRRNDVAAAADRPSGFMPSSSANYDIALEVLLHWQRMHNGPLVSAGAGMLPKSPRPINSGTTSRVFLPDATTIRFGCNAQHADADFTPLISRAMRQSEAVQNVKRRAPQTGGGGG